MLNKRHGVVIHFGVNESATVTAATIGQILKAVSKLVAKPT